MSFWNVAWGLAKGVFSYLFDGGKSLLADGLELLADAFDWLSIKISMWLYNNGYEEWANKVRVFNRFVFNTLKTTAFVLSAWNTFETVSRIEIDGTRLDYIE